jgi:hypothetical protein
MSYTRERSPIMAKRENLIAELRADNFTAKKYSILVQENEIFICGESALDSITIPRDEFDNIVRWYLKKQRLPKRKKVEK